MKMESVVLHFGSRVVGVWLVFGWCLVVDGIVGPLGPTSPAMLFVFPARPRAGRVTTGHRVA